MHFAGLWTTGNVASFAKCTNGSGEVVDRDTNDTNDTQTTSAGYNTKKNNTELARVLNESGSHRWRRRRRRFT